MVDTQRLGRTPLVVGQTNKELSVNSSDDVLEHATQRILSVDMSSGNVALTESQWTTNFLFVCSGLTADRTLIAPTELTGHSANTAERVFAVRNEDSADTVTVQQDGAGATVDVLPGEEALLVANGTDVRRLGQQSLSMGSHFVGVPGASQVLMRFVFPWNATLPQNLLGSQGKALVAATAQTDVDIQKNGSSIGTMRWAAAGTVASFIFSTDQTFTPGDDLRLVAPGTADATLADLMWTFFGSRQ